MAGGEGGGDDSFLGLSVSCYFACLSGIDRMLGDKSLALARIITSLEELSACELEAECIGPQQLF